MKELWKEPLTNEEIDELISRIVTRVRRYRMETPAIFALEMHKPLAHVGATMALTASPMLIPFLGFDAFDDYSQLLSKRENWERLITELERSRETPEPKEHTA